ncbi:hypothetical protein OY671_009138, partial [Metschnikowia pulcherrima]
EQRRVFEEKSAPVFDRRFVRWSTDQPASSFGLGIPPAQFAASAGDQPMAAVSRQRSEKSACGFAINDNYFAWQAFSRGYGKAPECPLPPYSQEANWNAVRQRAERVTVRHANMTEHSAQQDAASLDRYVSLDAQDWMTDGQLNASWQEITRTARPGARVSFRTAAAPSSSPGRVDDASSARWRYHDASSLDSTARDRSSIYGGVHLYESA